MTRYRCVKKPIEVEVIEVTKAELKELLENNPISVSEHDAEWIAVECGDAEFIGYIAGDIDRLNSKDETKIPDIWFINKYYFKENYEIKEKK